MLKAAFKKQKKFFFCKNSGVQGVQVFSSSTTNFIFYTFFNTRVLFFGFRSLHFYLIYSIFLKISEQYGKSTEQWNSFEAENRKSIENRFGWIVGSNTIGSWEILFFQCCGDWKFRFLEFSANLKFLTFLLSLPLPSGSKMGRQLAHLWNPGVHRNFLRSMHSHR